MRGIFVTVDAKDIFRLVVSFFFFILFLAGAGYVYVEMQNGLLENIQEWGQTVYQQGLEWWQQNQKGIMTSMTGMFVVFAFVICLFEDW